MSAERLREAAALMRSRAEWANEGPWKRERQYDGQYGIDADGIGILGHGFVPTDAEHIASWHPDVALAVADWLDADATVIERHDLDASVSKAFAVADAYLGSAS